MKRIIKYCTILSFLLFIFVFVSIHSYASTISSNLSDNFFRLHIIANSNSAKDQSLKLLVRNAILEHLKSQNISVKGTKRLAYAILRQRIVFVALTPARAKKAFCVALTTKDAQLQ